MNKILIGLDLTQLYHTTKFLHLQVDYGALLKVITEAVVDADDDVTVVAVGFTKFSERNQGEIGFVSNLREVGIDVRTFPVSHTGGFDANILAEAMAIDADEVVFVSNNAAALDAAERLMADEEPALVASVAYFSEDVPIGWLPKLVAASHRRLFPFIDLSEENVRKRIKKKTAQDGAC